MSLTFLRRNPSLVHRRRRRRIVALPAALQRPDHRLRRRRPTDPGWHQPRPQSLSEPPSVAAGTARLFQPPPGAVVLFRRRLRRQLQSGAAPRRTHRRHLSRNWRWRWRCSSVSATRHRNCSGKACRPFWPIRPVTRTAPKSISKSCGTLTCPAAASWGWWNFAPSACRHAGAAGNAGGAAAGHRRPAGSRNRIIPNRSTGVGNCTTASPCPTTCAPICGRCWTNWPAPVWDWAKRSSRNCWTTAIRWLTEATFGGCRLTVRRGLEFWPLLGDALAQEHGHSRLVDASSTRLEISLRADPDSGTEHPDLADWQLTVNGYRLPLRREDEIDGETRVYGLRYRRFKPWTGLHPTWKRKVRSNCC
jgi:hypothetical protein